MDSKYVRSYTSTIDIHVCQKSGTSLRDIRLCHKNLIMSYMYVCVCVSGTHRSWMHAICKLK